MVLAKQHSEALSNHSRCWGSPLSAYPGGSGKVCVLIPSTKPCVYLLMVSRVCMEEREQEEVARREKAHLQEMDEEEYDALTEEQKAQFDDHILQVQRERRRRSVSFTWAALQYGVPEGFPHSHLPIPHGAPDPPAALFPSLCWMQAGCWRFG